jgi:NAD(P)H-hydrate epimerase
MATETVAFHALKVGHLIHDGPGLCGTVTVADIGLHGGDPAMLLMEGDDVVLPIRQRHVHKWNAGAVATIGGVSGLTGAALFAARSAIAAGAGVSTIFTTAATSPVYETLAPDIPTVQASESGSWQDHASEVLALLDRYDVVIVGPGLEPADPTFVERLLERFDGAMVIDAGAITSITNFDTLARRDAPTVLTPHAGEFTRFSGLSPTHESARQVAAATRAAILLKGNPTFVAGENLVAIARGGPELASIGTGDVLAGVIAALLAAGMPAEEAARTGAYVHASAGAYLARVRTVTAPALIDAVAVEMTRLRRGEREHR